MRQALADLLGVDISQLALSQGRRRSKPRTIKFEIVGDAKMVAALSTELMSSNLASQLSSQLSTQYNMSVSAQVSGKIATPTARRPEGEVWQEVNGQYILRKCPRGFLLVNTTVELSFCKECIPGSYSFSDVDGCNQASQPPVCDTRDCTVCPAGALCAAGRNSADKHFIPKALQIGGKVHPVANVKMGAGSTSKFFCDQETLQCTQLDLSLANHAGAAKADDESYLWEYDGALMLLQRCPAGTVLINRTQSEQFDAAVQECSPCGPGRYVIDPMIGPCMTCPEGADCAGPSSNM